MATDSPSSQSIESQVLKFLDAWSRGERPEPRDYLPPDEDPHNALLELLHAELQYRLRNRELIRVESLIERYPELYDQPDDIAALLATEFRQRRRQEPELTALEFHERFPQLDFDFSTMDWTHHDRPPTVVPLEKVAGYTLLNELGRGGMGVVYRAIQLDLQRPVALKTLRAAADERELRRFRTEAELLARLRHPQIVPIYAIGMSDGRPFFTMELIDGGNLASQLTLEAMPAMKAAELVRQLAMGIAAAHRIGIVHRDLKPANILLTLDGTPKITDFGLAKHLESTSLDMTDAGQLIGTPSYMSPEQASGESMHIGPATDIFSLGAILYECLTGRTPFRGISVHDTLRHVREIDPIPIRRLRRLVPRDLETITLRCLHKQPSQRYATAELLADDLARFHQGLPVMARPILTTERVGRWMQRNPLFASAIGLLGMVIVGIIGLGIQVLIEQANEVMIREAGIIVLQAENAAKSRIVMRLDQALKQSEQRRADVTRFSGMSAKLIAEMGQRIASEGRIDAGVLYLLRALEIDAGQNPAFGRAIRTSLTAWLREIHPVRWIADRPQSGDRE